MCGFFVREAENACTTQGELGPGRAGLLRADAWQRHPIHRHNRLNPLGTSHPPSHAGFLSVYMHSECQATCKRCVPDSPLAPPETPTIARPPTPDCAMTPDSGEACPFFFSNLVVSGGGEGAPGQAWRRATRLLTSWPSPPSHLLPIHPPAESLQRGDRGRHVDCHLHTNLLPDLVRHLQGATARSRVVRPARTPARASASALASGAHP